MITRSMLVEQLRDYQIRSQHKWAKLIIFSPKPQINSSADAVVAFSWALLFLVLLIFSCITLYFRHIWFSAIVLCTGILLLVCLRISRQRWLARKRLVLPLSM
ncbi:hypothetical protein AQUCO_00700195v1 [Aquilegia coerulea]|uniref:Uncharacterized protein n=1 Tax=Aquilegia coerulea TaxID=218851 RepID=A0A2G5EIZ7_AQUCA|nr:hypothetical protein AQUCO_00700195v1 [Aquilegia coerulea]